MANDGLSSRRQRRHSLEQFVGYSVNDWHAKRLACELVQWQAEYQA